MSGPGVNIVVALAAEATPLARAFGLRQRVSARLVPFEGSWQGFSVRLLAGGVGRLAAVAAAGLLRGLELAGEPTEASSRSLWLSAGLAGHRTRPLGQVVLATAVHDLASERKVSLPRAFATPCSTVELETHQQVVHEYPAEDRAVEMESAGFVGAARRYVRAPEQVQCLKVVSDNAQEPLSRGKPRLSVERIEGYAAQLVPVLELLLPRWAAALGDADDR
jgi:hypothetical protein